MTSIFISYAHEDSNIALRLYNDLKKVGITPWIDSENLLPGQDWKLAIKKAIRTSDYFIALFSGNSVNKKGYFQKEVRMAMSELEEMPPEKILFLPCRIEDVEILYEPLKELHWLDLFPSYQDGFKKLKLSLGISDSDSPEMVDNKELMRQVDQNLLKYKLAQTKAILEQPLLFSNPTWASHIILQTIKTKRRLNETITRVQVLIPMYNYVAKEVGNNKFSLHFKHDKSYSSFSKQLEQLLINEGVQILEANTQKNKIQKGYSALVIPPDDREAAMIRGSNGRSVFVSSEGNYYADTGEKVSDEELENLSPDGGFFVSKG